MKIKEKRDIFPFSFFKKKNLDKKKSVFPPEKRIIYFFACLFVSLILRYFVCYMRSLLMTYDSFSSKIHFSESLNQFFVPPCRTSKPNPTYSQHIFHISIIYFKKKQKMRKSVHVHPSETQKTLYKLYIIFFFHFSSHENRKISQRFHHFKINKKEIRNHLMNMNFQFSSVRD